jgi:hypothetical protein
MYQELPLSSKNGSNFCYLIRLKPGVHAIHIHENQIVQQQMVAQQGTLEPTLKKPWWLLNTTRGYW